MILAIDIGNTNIVLGGIEDGEILFESRMATDTAKTSDQYHLELRSMLGLFDVNIKALEGVIIASVVPQVLNSMHTAVIKMTGMDPIIIGPGIKTGLNVHVDNPKTVGSDLIVAAVAGMRFYGAPLMIVDMGTPWWAPLPSSPASAWRPPSGPSAGTPWTVCAAASCWAPRPCSTACWTAWRRSWARTCRWSPRAVCPSL